MNLRTKTLASLLFGATLFLGCGDDGASTLPSDDAEASFGGANSKADGKFGACELRETVNFLNESTTDVETLKEFGVNRRAGKNIIAHRNGPDGILGTGDDDLFDDLDELDAVSYVGPVTLEQVIHAIDARCVSELDSRPYIDSKTFGSSTGGGFTRDNVELEATMTVEGITGAKLHEILTSTDSRGRTIFSRIRKSKKVEAFTYGFPVDEVPWNKDAMEAREALPYVTLSIESDRFVASSGEKRELSLGTDIMDDTYYDTKDFALLEQDMLVRGRVRWDTDTEVRRLLIAAKFGSNVNEEGLKQAAKVDVRTEGGRYVSTLDDDVMRGKVSWSGRATPIKPIEEVYSRLVEADMLPDIDGREKVLLLEPMVHIRSFRSRYHLNEADIRAVQKFYRNGISRIEAVVTFLEAGVADNSIAAADAEEAIAMGRALLDGSLLEQTVAAQLETLGATPDVVAPDQFATPADQVTLDKQQVVAEAMDGLLRDFEEVLDDIDRDVTGTRGLDGDDYVDMFVDWQRIRNSSLAVKTTIKPFLNAYKGMADVAEAVKAFNDFGEQQKAAGESDFERFEPITEALWANLGSHLTYEWLKISRRMIIAGAVTSNALWFDMAREFYVPESRRSSYSNFMIDTFDYTEMVSQPEWMGIDESKRNPANTIDPAMVFHTTLVNEVQIELGSEKPYLDKLAALDQEIEASPDDEELKRKRAGAVFIFDQYRAALTTIAALKGDDIVDRLEDEGASKGVEWVPAALSKGKTALTIIRK